MLLYQPSPGKLPLSPLRFYLVLVSTDVNGFLFLGLAYTKVALFCLYVLSSAFLLQGTLTY